MRENYPYFKFSNYQICIYNQTLSIMVWSLIVDFRPGKPIQTGNLYQPQCSDGLLYTGNYYLNFFPITKESTEDLKPYTCKVILVYRGFVQPNFNISFPFYC